MAKEKDDISIDKKDQGKFTAWVKNNMPGKSTCEAANVVMKNKKKYKPNVVKMANYAKNFGCSKKDSPSKFNPTLVAEAKNPKSKMNDKFRAIVLKNK